MVAFGAQLEDSAAEQVELNSHLGRHARVDDARELVRSEDAQRVVSEVKHRDEVVVANSLQGRRSSLVLSAS